MAQWLSPTELSKPRCPELDEGEEILPSPTSGASHYPGVAILNDEGADSGYVGDLVLTTARLVLCMRDGNAGALHLDEVTAVTKDGGGPLGLGLLMPKAVSITFRSRLGEATLKMEFRDKEGDRDQVLDELQKALQRLKMQGDTSETTPAGTPRSRAEDMEELARAGSDGRLRRMVVIYENNRRPLMDSFNKEGSDRGFHHSALLPGERRQFSDSEGEAEYANPREAGSQAQLDSLLPRTAFRWEWEPESSWQVLTETGRTDEEGWEYAWNWTRKVFTPIVWSSTMQESLGNTSWVRRRRWVRRAVEPPGQAAGAAFGIRSFDIAALRSKLPNGLLDPVGKFSVADLETQGGGPAKVGWLWKEGGLGARIGKGDWERRYWVLWPAEADPLNGRLLFYFVDSDSPKPSGVLHVPGVHIREPKTMRPKYKSRRLHINKVVDVSEANVLQVKPTKLIIGAETDELLQEW